MTRSIPTSLLGSFTHFTARKHSRSTSNSPRTLEGAGLAFRTQLFPEPNMISVPLGAASNGVYERASVRSHGDEQHGGRPSSA